MKLKTILFFTSLALLAARADTITVTSIADSGTGSLRNALASAADGDTIDATGVAGTILLTSGEVLVNKSLTIVGPGPGILAVDGNASDRVFFIAPSNEVTIVGFTITHGWDSEGGGIYNDHASLILSDCAVIGNAVGSQFRGIAAGGGIYNNGSSGAAMLTIVRSTIIANSAFNRFDFASAVGGGIYNDGSGGNATLKILDSDVSGNSVTNSDLLSESDFFDNVFRGGGIYNEGIGGATVVTISNCTINGNSAANFGWGYEPEGGGIYNSSGILTLINSAMNGNSAQSPSGQSSGGGIFTYGHSDLAALTISSSVLSSNWAGEGEAICDAAAMVVIVNSDLSNNSAVYAGGGISTLGWSGPATLTFVNSTLRSNSAPRGGGIGIYSDATLNISNTTVAGNSASDGGGVFVAGYGATLTVANSTFSGNSANGGYEGSFGHGGGILNNAAFGSATLAMVNSTFSDNRAWAGSGICNEGRLGLASVTIANSTFREGLGSYPYGAAIFNGGSNSGNAILVIRNSVLDAPLGNGIQNVSGTVSSGGYNLSNGDGGGLLTATGDQINTWPLLGPLQDNGGPTLTHALLPGSPAIDQGKDLLGSPSDQRGRGFERTSDDPSVANAAGGDGTDIGAFEIQQVPPPQDSDGDGVTDDVDECPDTRPGDIVSSTGCSIAQLVPCDGPLSGGAWKNHGQYVRAVVRSATHFLRAGLITRRQWAQIVTDAAHSKCGWNRRSDHDGDRDWHRNWDWNHDGDEGRERRGDKDHDWH